MLGVRTYKLGFARDLSSIEAALRALDSRGLWGPLDSERSAEECLRVVKLERLKAGTASLEALIRVSYRVKGRKLWSDLYDLRIAVAADGAVVIVKRISGLGRTDPDFIVGELARLLAQQGH